MKPVLILLAVTLLVFLPSDAGQTAKQELYGAEANPTGDPIGGGAGYRRILEKGDYTVKTLEELLAALKEAQADQVVYVAADKIDLTGQVKIAIPAGVTLAGNRGKKDSPGPLLFNSKMPDHGILFIAGENARVTGLRVKGSDANFPDIDYNVVPRSWAGGIGAGNNVEVDNCEISNFHYGGVSAVGKGVRVHHSLIHDVHAYPVVVQTRGEALVEAKIIHWIWHTIAGSGGPESGYEARYNMVIRDKPPESWGAGHKSHGFDMHGFYDYAKKRLYPGRMAGNRIIIHHNTMRNNGPALGVLIRGIPREICEIYNNWFSEEDPALAVGQVKPPGNVWVYNNVYGPDKKPVPIAMQTTPQILFKTPQAPTRELEKVKGKLALDIEVNVLKGLQLKSVAIQLDGKEIYSGEKAPQPGKVVINTAQLENGEHELSVIAVDNREVAAKYSIKIIVEN